MSVLDCKPIAGLFGWDACSEVPFGGKNVEWFGFLYITLCQSFDNHRTECIPTKIRY